MNKLGGVLLNQNIKIAHVDGKVNLADIFTKEDKDSSHYIALRLHRKLMGP